MEDSLRLLHASRLQDLMPILMKPANDQTANRFVVIDHQDFRTTRFMNGGADRHAFYSLPPWGTIGWNTKLGIDASQFALGQLILHLEEVGSSFILRLPAEKLQCLEDLPPMVVKDFFSVSRQS